MGVRNPFRIAVDRASGALYWGDVGPDAPAVDPLRGPAGHDEVNVAFSPGNFGWPYLIADNKPYRDYDFATGLSGPAFDPNSLINNSPNNTGLTNLPPARGALLWYPYGASTDFPAITAGNRRAALAGAVYTHSPAVASGIALPAYFDRTLFFLEWSRSAIYEVKVDAAGGVLQVAPFLPGFGVKRPIDAAFGPDGAMYLLEWGSSGQGTNTDSQLSRFEYSRGNRSPVARAAASVTSGPVPLVVQFTSAGSLDPDPGDTISFAWDFDSNGTSDATEPHPTHSYGAPGIYTAQLRVSDSRGRSATASITLWAGNTAPSVTFLWPPHGGFFDAGDEVAWSLRVDDAEDGSTATGGIAPTDVQVEYRRRAGLEDSSFGQSQGVSGTAITPDDRSPGRMPRWRSWPTMWIAERRASVPPREWVKCACSPDGDRRRTTRAHPASPPRRRATPRGAGATWRGSITATPFPSRRSTC